MCRIFSRFVGIWSLLTMCAGTTLGSISIPPRQDPDKIKWLPGEVLVKFKDDVEIQAVKGQRVVRTNILSITALNRTYKVSEMEKVFKTAKPSTEPKYIKTYTGNTVEVPQLFNWYKLKVPEETDIQGVVRAYKDNPNVLRAEPNYIAQMHVEPNDPSYPSQWGLGAIKAPLAWDVETGNETLILGILDTGVDWDHPDLTDRIWTNSAELNGTPGVDDDGNDYVDDIRGWDFVLNDNDPMDDNGHGTHCAGIAAATTNNSLGVAGTSWNGKIMVLKCLNNVGQGSYADIAKAVNYASNKGANVISMSLGGYAESGILRDALENAYATSVIVASAGNDRRAVDKPVPPGYAGPSPCFPAAYSFVIGVEAVLNSSGEIAGFSNIDPNGPTFTNNEYNYEVRAPGVNILSTLLDNTYGSLSGTSMACPFVSGVALLLKARHPTWSNEHIMAQLVNTSSPILDAYTALTDVPTPNLAYQRYIVIDTLPGDDRDSIVDAGEDIELIIAIKNYWGQATGVQLTLRLASFEDPSLVTITDSVADYGGISPYATDRNDDNPLCILFSANIKNNQAINFDYEITCNEGAGNSGSFFIRVEKGTEVSGIISQNTTWTSDKLWLITHHTLVSQGVTLTIQPGTEIKIYPDKYIRIDGTLKAIGKPDSFIVFTSNKPTPQIDDWRYIRFAKTSTNCTLRYAKIEYGGCYDASILYQGAVRIDSASPVIEYCEFSKNVTAICIYRGTPLIRYNNILYNNYQGSFSPGISLCGGSPTITKNRIIENIGERWGGGRGGGMYLYCYYDDTAIVSYNLIACNVVENRSAPPLPSAGIYISGASRSHAIVRHNTITENKPITDVPDNEHTVTIDAYNVTASFRHNNIVGNKGAYEFGLIKYPRDVEADSNWWGTTDTTQIDQKIWDYWDSFEGGKVLYSPILTSWDTLAPAFVANIAITPAPPIGLDSVEFKITFSRSMDITISPYVTFGVVDPYTQHKIEGNWLNMREWAGKFLFTPTTGDGINHLRITSAVGTDGIEIAKSTRVKFRVDVTGAASEGFAATAGVEKVDLTWRRPDLQDLMGFNLYRYHKLTEDTFSDTSLINRNLILDTSYTDTAVEVDTTYFYMFTILNTDFRESGYSSVISATPYGVGVQTSNLTPTKYILFAGHPNPFSSRTQIRYGLPRSAKVSLKIYNAAGQEVYTLVDEIKKPGYYTIVWDGKDRRGKSAPSGIYFYQLETDDYKATKKLILLR